MLKCRKSGIFHYVRSELLRRLQRRFKVLEYVNIMYRVSDDLPRHASVNICKPMCWACRSILFPGKAFRS